MKSWIKILSALAFAASALACEFKQEGPSIYSLSGPVTAALKETGLLKDKKLKGISVFHPVFPEEYSGKILPGGLFLSRESAKEMKGALVFHDEGRELARMLKGMETIPVELRSRNLSPHAVMEKVKDLLASRTQGCEEKLKLLIKRTQEVGERVLEVMPKKFTGVFFLGPIKGTRYPDMAMTNDGFVRWLREKGRLKTYASDLAYVSWSMKLLSELPKDAYKIGLIDSGNKPLKEVKKIGEHSVNITYPGLLVPGLTQLEGALYLFTHLKGEK